MNPQGPQEVVLPPRSHPKSLPKGAWGPSRGTPSFSSLLFWSGHVACVSSLARSAPARGAHITILLGELSPRAPHAPQLWWQVGRELISWHRSRFRGLGGCAPSRGRAARRAQARRPLSVSTNQTVVGKISTGASKCTNPSGSLTGVGGRGPGGSARTREHVQGRGAAAEPFGWVCPGEATAVLCGICTSPRPPAERIWSPGDIGSCHLPGELFRSIIIAL